MYLDPLSHLSNSITLCFRRNCVFVVVVVCFFSRHNNLAKTKVEGKWGEKRFDGGTGKTPHQAKFSRRAKDMVTRSAVMILVSDHTYRPPCRDPICIQPPLQPPAPPPSAVAANSLGTAAPAKPGQLPLVVLDTAAIFRNRLLPASGFQSRSKLESESCRSFSEHVNSGFCPVQTGAHQRPTASGFTTFRFHIIPRVRVYFHQLELHFDLEKKVAALLTELISI